MNRRRFLATLGTAGVAGLAGCTALGTSDDGGDDFDIGMTAVAFTPQTHTVSVGEAVVWKNTSSRAHTVTAYEAGIPDGASFFASGGFDSESEARDAFGGDLGGSINSGETYSYTF
ncbi:MAG: halocyanin, partial [Halobacteriota archaeon]